MLRLAFMFPGQGSQYPGMARELSDHYAEAAEIFEAADHILGYSLSDICFNGPKETLDRTEFAQPAILVSSLAVLAVLRKHGIEASFYAGLSLGEYTALLAAGAASLEEILPLVEARGRIMQEAVPLGYGAMAAIMHTDTSLVEQICRDCTGLVSVANYNCPGQVVISGEKPAVDAACQELAAAGAKVHPLAVSVPSHCDLMRSAADELRKYAEKINWQASTSQVVNNVNAQTNPPEAYPDLLCQQLYCPVRWEESMRWLMERVDLFIEVGPGKTLSGLLRRIDRSRLAGNVEDLASLNNLLKKVQA